MKWRRGQNGIFTLKFLPKYLAGVQPLSTFVHSCFGGGKKTKEMTKFFIPLPEGYLNRKQPSCSRQFREALKWYPPVLGGIIFLITSLLALSLYMQGGAVVQSGFQKQVQIDSIPDNILRLLQQGIREDYSESSSTQHTWMRQVAQRRYDGEMFRRISERNDLAANTTVLFLSNDDESRDVLDSVSKLTFVNKDVAMDFLDMCRYPASAATSSGVASSGSINVALVSFVFRKGDVLRCLQEIHRMLEDGGDLYILEFNVPGGRQSSSLIPTLTRSFVQRGMLHLGRWIANLGYLLAYGQYIFLNEVVDFESAWRTEVSEWARFQKSVQNFPNWRDFARVLSAVGFDVQTVTHFSSEFVQLYHAHKSGVFAINATSR